MKESYLCMAITTTISKPLEQGYVQVDAKRKNGYTRYYKVPRKSAKSFSNKLKKQDKDMNLYTNIAIFSTMFTGILASAYLTRKMKSRMQQFFIQVLSAIVPMTAVTVLMNDKAIAEHDKLLKQYKATEIYYKV